MGDSGTKPPQAILLDIEGTATSLSFVKDVLFPYARQNLETYLKDSWQDAEIRGIIQDLRVQAETDLKNGIEAVPQVLPLVDTTEIPDDLLKSVLLYVWWLMDQDRKATPLKALQGKIWKNGYDKGELKGHIYEDVPAAFKKWTEEGRKLYIFSSGSVQAQILLFGNSQAGDLSQYLSGYFDTTTGPKNDPTSYNSIASKIELSPENLLFLTDVTAEGYAAKEAGLDVRILLRPGNKPISESELADFQTADNFNDL